ncbi:MAG: DUF2460 domain-containing protein [Proteobacteria bacterium]|nr:DUF2460 domain-containing protein [Pseudomonadota bacterium]
MYKISYTGDSAVSEFAFNFPFFQPADVHVAINSEVMDGASYNLSANEDLTGGTITFATPPAIGAAIDIFRKICLERFIDYQPTAKIDPERLNDDFNFLLEAFRDLDAVNIDLAAWQNIHDNVLNLVRYTKDMIEDKLGGGAALGLYNNLLAVLSDALPALINDYGSIADPVPDGNKDDYGEM